MSQGGHPPGPPVVPQPSIAPMSNFAILRIEKLKDYGTISAASQHVLRTRPVPNADPRRHQDNQVLIGPKQPGEVVKSIKHRFEQLGIKPRKNSVLALQAICTFSPEMKKHIDIDQWSKDSVKWLREYFGEENIISCVLHMDETTPHLHAIITPITRDNRLSAREFVNGKAKLSEMQDSYAKAMEGHGLRRGLRGSRVSHQHVKVFYGALKKTYEEPFSEERVMGRRLVERVVEETERRRWFSDDFLEELRSIDLMVLAETLGHQRSKKDKRKFKTPAGAVSITGQKFKLWGPGNGGGYGAISYLIATEGFDFVEAVKFLQERFGKVAAENAQREWTAIKAATTAKPIEIHFSPPQRSKNKDDYLAVIKMLENRGIRSEIARAVVTSGQLYPSRRGRFLNAIALNWKRTGAEIRGVTCPDFRAQAAGGTVEAVLIKLPNTLTRAVVITEGVIDAISAVDLFGGKVLAISTGGLNVEAAIKFVEQHSKLCRNVRILVAYDWDDAGEKEAKRLVTKLQRHGFEAQRLEMNEILDALKIKRELFKGKDLTDVARARYDREL